MVGACSLPPRIVSRAARWAGLARPAIAGGDHQAIEADLTEIALVDPVRLEALAQAPGRASVELAGAAVVTVAGRDLGAFDQPVDVSHGSLLVLLLDPTLAPAGARVDREWRSGFPQAPTTAM